jgi:hypothetical protein
MESSQFPLELQTDHEPQRVFTTGTETQLFQQMPTLMKLST